VITGPTFFVLSIGSVAVVELYDVMMESGVKSVAEAWFIGLFPRRS
jgi:hypothetical protein